MTRREELQEAYEDAMFALLMDYVAESEGKKALEENRATPGGSGRGGPPGGAPGVSERDPPRFSEKVRPVGRADHDEGNQ